MGKAHSKVNSVSENSCLRLMVCFCFILFVLVILILISICFLLTATFIMPKGWPMITLVTYIRWIIDRTETITFSPKAHIHTQHHKHHIEYIVIIIFFVIKTNIQAESKKNFLCHFVCCDIFFVMLLLFYRRIDSGVSMNSFVYIIHIFRTSWTEYKSIKSDMYA